MSLRLKANSASVNIKIVRLWLLNNFRSGKRSLSLAGECCHEDQSDKRETRIHAKPQDTSAWELQQASARLKMRACKCEHVHQINNVAVP